MYDVASCLLSSVPAQGSEALCEFRRGHFEMRSRAKVVLPGSFNPLHKGHTGMMEAACRFLSLDPSEDAVYELAVANADKGAIEREEVREICLVGWFFKGAVLPTFSLSSLLLPSPGRAALGPVYTARHPSSHIDHDGAEICHQGKATKIMSWRIRRLFWLALPLSDRSCAREEGSPLSLSLSLSLSLYVCVCVCVLLQAPLFPGAVFVVGSDTAERLVIPKYYGSGTEEDMIKAFETLRAHKCSFLVAGRSRERTRYYA